MSERTRSLCLPPFVQTNAGVLERDTIGIQTFTVRSVNRNKLGREVQHLPEFCLLVPDLFLGSFALGDVGHGPDKLPIAGCILHCASYRVDVLDSPVTQ